MFLKTQECGLVPLAPVVSNIIQDKKAHSDLQIVDYSDDSSPVHGMYQLKNISITTSSNCTLMLNQFFNIVFCFFRWQEDTFVL